VELTDAREFEAVAGSGVQYASDRLVQWYAALDEGIGIETSSLQQQWEEYLGKTVIWIAVDGTVQGIMEFRMP